MAYRENSGACAAAHTHPPCELAHDPAGPGAEVRPPDDEAPTEGLPAPMAVNLYDFARASRFGANPVFNFRILPPKFKNALRPTKEDLAQFEGAKVPYFAWLQAMLDPYGVRSAPFNEQLSLDLLNRAKPSTLRKIERTNSGPDSRAVYFVVNRGGQKKEDIKQFTAFFIEFDDILLEEQYVKVMGLPIPPRDGP
jgi:hypothetical protein